MARVRTKFMVTSRAALITEARELKSERGENPEYDRGLAELIYWTCGGLGDGVVGLGDVTGDVEGVKREIGIISKK